MIRVWWLLRELGKDCHKMESMYPDHAFDAGHSFRGVVEEHVFLHYMAKGNPKKRALYADLLVIAENKMKLLSTRNQTRKCQDCGKEISSKIIRLNSEGLDFIGVSDLVEHLFSRYKLTWTLLLIPIITFFLGGLSIPYLVRLIKFVVGKIL